jgi:AraC-like DNA-binding protein
MGDDAAWDDLLSEIGCYMEVLFALSSRHKEVWQYIVGIAAHLEYLAVAVLWIDAGKPGSFPEYGERLTLGWAASRLGERRLLDEATIDTLRAVWKLRNSVVHKSAVSGITVAGDDYRGGNVFSDLTVYSSQVSAALDYLADHYAVASVRRLGRAVGAAPHYLSALFRAEIGISPRAYINQLRVEVARWLLLETGEKLETIAAQIGLHDASHFSRLFLKHAGNRPGVYRQERGLNYNRAPTVTKSVEAVKRES